MPSPLVVSAASGLVLGALALGCDRAPASHAREGVGKDPSAGAARPATASPTDRAAGELRDAPPAASARVDPPLGPQKSGEMACGGAMGCSGKK